MNIEIEKAQLDKVDRHMFDELKVCELVDQFIDVGRMYVDIKDGGVMHRVTIRCDATGNTIKCKKSIKRKDVITNMGTKEFTYRDFCHDVFGVARTAMRTESDDFKFMIPEHMSVGDEFLDI